MCPYCKETVSSKKKCELCDEYQSNVEELLTTAWTLQHSIINETASIKNLVYVHGQSLSKQVEGTNGVQVLQIERDRQVEEHENMVEIANEMNETYAIELKEIEENLLLLTEEASLYGINLKNPFAFVEKAVQPAGEVTEVETDRVSTSNSSYGLSGTL